MNENNIYFNVNRFVINVTLTLKTAMRAPREIRPVKFAVAARHVLVKIVADRPVFSLYVL